MSEVNDSRKPVPDEYVATETPAGQKRGNGRRCCRRRTRRRATSVTRQRRLIGTLNHGAKRAETRAPFTALASFFSAAPSPALTHCKWTRFFGGGPRFPASFIDRFQSGARRRPPIDRSARPAPGPTERKAVREVRLARARGELANFPALVVEKNPSSLVK